MRSRRWAILAAAGLALASCSNNPYPDADDSVKVRYRALAGPPKNLDPAVTYNVADHKITANVYETLLEYHYLKRPYQLLPALAEAVPEPETLADGRVRYRFRLRPGMRFQSDPCFDAAGQQSATREIVAADVAFELMRIGDPEVVSPVVAFFEKIDGFSEFSERLTALREADPAFGEMRIDRQYAAADGVSGIAVRGDHELEIALHEPYPQILYWFAMPFTAPVPWEAIEYYDGEDGRPFFKEHPIATGPFELTHYAPQSRVVLSRNENWYGALHPEWRAPGAVYPSEGEADDAERGLLDPDYVGRPLPFIDRIEFRIEKESIPLFNKFLQGYYDASGITKESFGKVIQEGDLSPAMVDQGIRLAKSVSLDVWYIGFNMRDPVVGTPARDRARKLRQAMSLAIDSREFTRVFANGRGVSAQSPLPPGIYGYDADYRNPYRVPDLERARALLREAGYAGGIDPETGKPLRLTFNGMSTATQARLQYQFFIDAWKPLGLDVRLEATNYNQYRTTIRKGAYQVFLAGWVADYPDPENFLLLLWGPNANARVPGALNTANFEDPRFDELFGEMKDMENGPGRMERIAEMQAIVERERPWIELYHRESYALYHHWIRNVKPAGISYPATKYVDIDPLDRAQMREAWNEPITWPAYALVALGFGITVPGVVTFFRERQ